MSKDPSEIATMVADFFTTITARGIEHYIGLQLAMNYHMLVIGQPGDVSLPAWHTGPLGVYLSPLEDDTREAW